MHPAELQDIISKSIDDGIISCIGIEVIKEGTNVLSLYKGTPSFEDSKPIDENTYFDLASLTKPITTTTLAGIFMEKDLISTDTKLAEIYNEYALAFNPALSEVTLGNLLSHSSGLDAWYDLYDIVHSRSDAYMFLRTRGLSCPPGAKYLYSDLGFILLGEGLELISGKKLQDLNDLYITTPLHLYNLKYIPVSEKDEMNVTNVVCTGYSSIRNRMLYAEVQDENTFVMNGVSGHAGLFGTAQDVTKFASHLLSVFLQKNTDTPVISQETIKKLWTRSREDSDWAYGWHYPSPGTSTAGRFISPGSVGMTGFTGCSLWIDLQKKIIITILANRTVSPFSAKMGGEKDKFSELRPLLHDKILGAL
jgi:CubicO group peptidase (beta-lactamase class C family)